MREIKKKKKEPSFKDTIIVEEIINSRHSKIFFCEKYTNSDEYFPN